MQFQTLSHDQLYRAAPSIFTTDSAERTTDRYTHISTLDVIKGLENEGFMPVWATQCNTRKPSKAAFTKHMLRFRHTNAVANDRGLFPELVLVNSHDGLSSYRLMAGIYRMVCANGLIAGDTFQEIKVRHQGDIVGNVIEGTYTVMDESQKLLENSESMSSIILDSDEKRIFSEAVHQLRFDGQSTDESGIKPSQFLRVRRHQESGQDDLFTLFNVAQENVIKGGLSGYAVNPEGRYTLRGTDTRVSKVSTRAIKSIDQSNSLNRALWTLAEKMRELKSA